MEAIVSAIAFLALCALLFAASVTDIRERKIPNWLVASIVGLWLVWRTALIALGAVEPVSLAGSFGGAIVFAAGLLIVTAIAERLTGKFMMGGGDIKLLAAVALFLGFNGILVALFVACLISFAYAAAHLKRGIPFAPCIMGGTLLAMLAL